MKAASFKQRLIAMVLASQLVAGPAAAQGPPIAGAGDWLLVDALPGYPGHACTARINGPEADTMLLLNNGDIPILVAGRADWSNLGGAADIMLSIDGEAPRPLNAQMAGNLVMVMVSDARLQQRLRGARTLDWTLPFGHFRANVTGMGTALDAISACRAASRTQPTSGT